MLKNYKYFRVKKLTKNNNTEIFMVEAKAKWYHDWVEFSKENVSLADALNQIETIHNHAIINIEIVHKQKFK